MIHKKWMELIQKYSFVKKVERDGAYVFIEYFKNGATMTKRIASRATGTQLQSFLSRIKKDLDIKTQIESKDTNYFII